MASLSHEALCRIALRDLAKNNENKPARIFTTWYTESTMPRGAFIRSIDADDLMENFLVAAVATVLAIRAYLYAMDYPALGESVGLHFAHVLWGGLLMFVALASGMAFLDRTSRRFSAILGGVGFGAFIDELGKFVTKDNDYFFEPTIAILYIVFILLFLLIRILAHEELRSEEYIANAFELTKEAVIRRIDTGERDEALALLRRSRSSDPAARALADMLRSMDVRERRDGWYGRLRKGAQAAYEHLVRNRLYETGLVSLLALNALIQLITIPKVIHGAGATLFWLVALIIAAFRVLDGRRSGKRAESRLFIGLIAVFAVLLVRAAGNIPAPDLAMGEWGELGASALSALCVVAGILRVRRSRREAYTWFKRAVLIAIFLTQFFLFYRVQLIALPQLVFSILAFTFLQYAIRAEAGVHRDDVKAA